MATGSARGGHASTTRPDADQFASPSNAMKFETSVTSLRRRVWSSFTDSVAHRLAQPIGGVVSPLPYGRRGRQPSEWDEDEVCEWLRDMRLAPFEALVRDQGISGAVLLSIDGADLAREPLAAALREHGVAKFGQIRSFELAVHALRAASLAAPAARRERPSHAAWHSASPRLTFAQFESETLSSALVRLLSAFSFAVLVAFVSAGVMTFAHDRVPDMEKYPPLPDVVLDHIPVIPYAFEASEVAILLLTFIFFSLVACHKYRLVLLRRLFAITGSVFLLRCCTMLVTSLSVPGLHLNCKSFGQDLTLQDKLYHAWKIASTLGSSLQGTRTCGDYMFSGHTSVLTILNRFVSTYSPKGWHPLHIFCSALNGFGMFCILAAHEHYTLDVLMGFYVSTRTFQSYHAIAHANSAEEGQYPSGEAHKQRRRWFPMVSYLEKNIAGILPNEFELPFVAMLGW